MPRLADFKDHELGITLWAFAKLVQYDRQFFVAVVRVAEGRLDDFHPRALANTA